MDKRVRERRRLISRERGRRRAGLIFLGVLAVGAAAAFLWLRSSDVFAVETISAPVTHHLTQGQIADAVADARGVSLLKVSTGTIESALEALPYVRTVHVYRDFPNGLEIRLEEYEPAARVRSSDGKAWLMAEDGRVLERAASQTGPRLPLVVPAAEFVAQPGGQAPQTVVAALPLLVMLQASKEAGKLPAADRISVAAGGELIVQLEGGTELRLGTPTDLKRKMTVATAIIQEYLRDGKTLEYVDTSAADRPAVKPQ